MKQTYTIEGMTCGGCERALTRALQRGLPEARIEVSHARGEASIEGEHTEEQVRSVVERAGFRVQDGPDA